MKLSFKIPKGTSKEAAEALENTLSSLRSIKVDATKRMIHIETEDSEEYLSPQFYADDCKEIVNIITEFIVNNTEQ